MSQDINESGDLEEVLAILAEQVQRLDGRVGDLAGVVDQETTPTRRVTDWISLSADEAAERLLRLGDWIEDVLVGGYWVTRRELPDCWALHRPAVIHLCWLHDLYLSDYSPDAAPLSAAEWNVRWRPAGLALLREVIPTRLCRPRPDREGFHMVRSDQEGSQPARETAPPPPPGVDPTTHASRRSVPLPPPRPAPQRSAGDEPVLDPELVSSLAERRFWQGYLDQAIPLDADWRAKRPARETDPA